MAPVIYTGPDGSLFAPAYITVKLNGIITVMPIINFLQFYTHHGR